MAGNTSEQQSAVLDVDRLKLKFYNQQIEQLDAQIATLKAQRKALTLQQQDLGDKIIFDNTIEGDICDAEVGDEVVFISGEYKGQRVIVNERESCGAEYNGKFKGWYAYEVKSLDDSILGTFDHSILKKVK